MSDQIKWLHLSDFHFGKNPFEQDFSAKKLLGHLSEQKESGIEPDFIFITGDIANSGKEKEYDDF
ncbi:metallophosphoesterase family protein [Cupriavidus basilensis]